MCEADTSGDSSRTGYWTEAAAAVAKAITATDYNPEMLAIAAIGSRSNVKLRTAMRCPAQIRLAVRCRYGAHVVVHVGKERRRNFFLILFTARARAMILMIDQVFGGCSSVSRQDEWGNLMTLRTLENAPLLKS